MKMIWMMIMMGVTTSALAQKPKVLSEELSQILTDWLQARNVTALEARDLRCINERNPRERIETASCEAIVKNDRGYTRVIRFSGAKALKVYDLLPVKGKRHGFDGIKDVNVLMCNAQKRCSIL